LNLQGVDIIQVLSYLLIVLLILVIHDGPEVRAIGEVLSVLGTHVDQLHIVVSVQALYASAQTLDVVRSERVVTVLPVHPQDTHIETNAQVSVHLHMIQHYLILTKSLMFFLLLELSSHW
jgi:hypothetical protein